MPVISIIDLDDLVHYLREQGNMGQELAAIESYRAEYGTGQQQTLSGP